MNYTMSIVGFSVALFILGGPLPFLVADAAEAPVYKPPTRGAPGGRVAAEHAAHSVRFLSSRYCARSQWFHYE